MNNYNSKIEVVKGMSHLEQTSSSEEGVDLQYGEEVMGAYYSIKETEFSVWAPNANKVSVVLYEEQFASEGTGQIFEMEEEKKGIWRTVITGDQKNKFYHYQVKREGKINYAVDPYAKAVSQNGKKGVIINLEETNPDGWEQDQRPPLKYLGDSIIYEMHIRDFSISPHSGMKNKGKFIAFTEEGTTLSGTNIKTGIDHLKELGITHIHLLPIFDFGSVDESKDDDYNWGYDPLNYNVPEGSYATNPSEPVLRIKELKKMVQALHKNGIRIIMDVVYNHTYTTETSNFGKIAPKEYYRLNSDGEYSNGSGCGNEVASEVPMVRKFIIDSVQYWAQEYNIDGFRFDLMALHDQKTMKLIAKRLHQIDSSIIIYGEPWRADRSPLPIEKQMTKGKQKGLGIAVFNDDFRDAIKGSTRGEDRGYATGMISSIEDVKEGIVAGINTFANKPSEVVNYVSAHDDLALWDKIEKSNPVDNYENKVRMNNLCNAIVLTSQGIPFLHGGVELLRTKYGVANSYNSPDNINQIEWEKKSDRLDTFLYYQGLIKLRKNHPAFRMTTVEQIKESLEFLDAPGGVIAYQLKDSANGDSWEQIIVVYNPHHSIKEVTLPSLGKWKVVVKDKRAGVEILETITEKEIAVPKISTMVLYK